MASLVLLILFSTLAVLSIFMTGASVLAYYWEEKHNREFLKDVLFPICMTGLFVWMFIAEFTIYTQSKVKTHTPATIELQISEVNNQRDTTYIYHFE